MERIGLTDAVLEWRRLTLAQQDARTTEDRDAADHALSHFLRMNANGRLQEYFNNRRAE